MEIIRGFANLPKITLSTCGRDDDVFIDRLNYKYTTLILFVSSITITVKILQSDHIQCWVPAILSKYEHYINVYCWISNTYYVPYKEQTTSVTNKPERMIKYYQWVPLILLCLSFFFLLPRFFYRCLSKQSGIDMLNLADASINYMNVEKFDKRRRSLLYLANSIHFYSITNKSKRNKGGFAGSSAFGAQVQSSSGSKPYLYNILCCNGKFNGAYLITVFMITKIFYTINAFAQLFIMNLFLGFNYNSHGFHVLKDLTRGLMSNTNAISAQRRAEAEAAAQAFANKLNIKPSSPETGQKFMGPTVIFDTSDEDGSGGGSGGFGTSSNTFGSVISESIYSEPSAHTNMHRYFPRESACDFRIRANIDSLVHNYTVQCVLPINLYNEQLFLLLWAWLWLVCLANCYDIALWVYRLTPGSRYEYVRSRIRLRYSEASVKRSLNAFVYDYLTFDGVFVMRIMSLSMSDCVTHELLQTLWQNYTETARGGGGRQAVGGGSSAQSAAQNRDSRYSQRYSSKGGGGSNNPDNNDDGRYASNYAENI